MALWFWFSSVNHTRSESGSQAVGPVSPSSSAEVLFAIRQSLGRLALALNEQVGRARPLRPLHSRGNGRIRVMMMRANTGSDARDRETEEGGRPPSHCSQPASLSLSRAMGYLF